MPTPSIQTLTTDAQQVLNLDSISAVRSVVAVALANANTGTPLNPNLTTQQLWDQFYQVVTRPKSDIESIIANQLMKFLYSPPAPGGAGADKQVIFNDGGVLAGDADFLWNKTTNLLTVTGSATITGDLTVRTTGLVVGSTATGIGTTPNTWSGAWKAAQVGRLTLGNATTDSLIGHNFYNDGSYRFAANDFASYYDQVGGAHIWGSSVTSGTAGNAIGWTVLATLNSTGLGVGGSPSYKLSSIGTTNNQVVLHVGNTAGTVDGDTTNVVRFAAGSGANALWANARYDGFSHAWRCNSTTTEAMVLNSTGLGVGGAPLSGFRLNVNNGDFRVSDVQNEDGVELGWSAGAGSGFVQVYNRTTSAFKDLVLNAAVTINAAGNVGIGVAPSARFHSKAGAVTQGGIIETTGANALLSFADAGTSSYTRVQIGSSGNNLAAFINSVQAMTLDASGNLLVGKTAVGFGTVGVESSSSGLLVATRSASTDGASATMMVYSTGAAAYRFYVGMGGTVFATNTTISAISDSRLKENVQDIDVGLGAILALKPRKFDWKEGKGKNIKGDRGFIAQEFEQVFPQLVDEWKDEAPEGEAPYKSVRQDLIPVLVKAIQELTARVQTLETR